jgi:DNA-directed RNA polymerase subunit M/transcription elongation factor TFIIS|tara:strand:+ start:1170 stop:1382 length:213 start_codon:yes stop_codon:yes gene_type:complete
MLKWKDKNCSRCSGIVYLEKDIYGWYEQCLQCGYSRDLDTLYVEELIASQKDFKNKLHPSYITARRNEQE